MGVAGIQFKSKTEIWKEIPLYEGYYSVSNFGRIKSLKRIILNSLGREKTIPELIRSVSYNGASNHYTGDKTYEASITLYRSGVKRNYSVARLVYNSFIAPIDLDDYSYVIICKDGNGKNVHYKNLIKLSITERQERIFLRNRAESSFKFVDHKALASRRINNGTKVVTQYDRKGNRLAVFTSIKNAADSTNTIITSISAVLRGKRPSANGFIWIYGNGAKKINVGDRFTRARKEMGERRFLEVTQYSLTGNRISVYPSLSNASSVTKVNLSMISECINGNLNSAGNFIWRKGKGRNKISVKDILTRNELFKSFRKPVVQYDLDGCEISRFESIVQAAASIGVQPSSISAAARGKYNTCKGYLWRFK